MDDIENIVAPPPPRQPASVVLPHIKAVSSPEIRPEIHPSMPFTIKAPLTDDACPPEVPPTLPGSQSVYLKTYGCSHNVSDGEHIAGILSSYGYNMVSHMDDADAVVINSCTVKDPR